VRPRLRLVSGPAGPEVHTQRRAESAEGYQVGDDLPGEKAEEAGPVDTGAKGEVADADIAVGDRGSESERHLAAVRGVERHVVLEWPGGPGGPWGDEARGRCEGSGGHRPTIDRDSDGSALTDVPGHGNLLHACNVPRRGPARATVRQPVRSDSLLNAHRPTLVGIVTHLTIAEMLRRDRGSGGATLATDAFSVASPHVPPGHASRRHAVLFEVVGYVVCYLNRCLPGPSWRFHGAELTVPGGRVDIVWAGPDGACLYDEIKTTRLGGATSVGPVWVEQARRYAITGRDAHGPAFAGVRLVVLGALHSSAVIAPDGAVTGLLLPGPATPGPSRSDESGDA